jgi:phage terminase small subunit
MLTKKQKKFADEYLETGNGTKAALKAYDIKAKDKENMAAVIASANIRKDKIKDYLESKAERAAEVIFELLENAENETVKLNAGKDILDRAGHKPTEKIDHTSNGEQITGINYILPNGTDSTSNTQATPSVSSSK